MRKKKLLILGSTGMLGSSRYWFDERFLIQKHARTEREDIDFIADLECIDEVSSMINKASPDVIVNLAALTNVDACENAGIAYKANVLTAKNIADSVARFPGVKPFVVHLSTDHIYDGISASSESDLKIVNMYAFSKFSSELAFRNIDHTILRVNFFCKSQSQKKSFTDWLYQALAENSKITLFNDVHFNPLTDITLIKNLLNVCEKQVGGVFNLGASTSLSKASFAQLFASELGLSFNNPRICSMAESGFQCVERPKNMHMNVDLFERTFRVRLPALEDEIQMITKEYINE